MDARRSLRFRVLGLGCGSGAGMIERVLASADGTLRVDVNPATEPAAIEYDPTATNPDALARAVERAGYRAGAPLGG